MYSITSAMTSTLKCNNCNLVVDEMLSYIQNKMSLIDEESLIKICLSTFTSVQIEKSKSLLFESLPSDHRKPARKGQGKDNRVLNDIITVLKVTEPDVMPVFVARDLGKLPPITFDHLDVSKLLKDIAIVQAEINDIKASFVTVHQLEDLKKEVKNMVVSTSQCNVNMKRGTCRGSEPLLLSHLRNSLSECCENQQINSSLVSGDTISSCDANLNKNPSEGNDNNLATKNKNPLPSLLLCTTANESSQSDDNIMLNDQLADSIQVKCKQSFADAAGQQCHIINDETISPNNEWTLVQSRKHRFKERFMGKMGKSVIDNAEKFKAADRNVPIFITNVHKNTVEDDIINYIRRKTAINVKLEKIKVKKQTDYNAYKFFVLKHNEHIFLNNEMWPQGIIFRRFVHFRPKPKNPDTGSGDGTSSNING